MFPGDRQLLWVISDHRVFRRVWIVESSAPNCNNLNITIKHIIIDDNWLGFSLEQRNRLGADGDRSCTWGLVWDHLGFIWAPASWPCPVLFARGRGIWIPVWSIHLKQLPEAWVLWIICVPSFGGAPLARPLLYQGIYIRGGEGRQPWWLAVVAEDVPHVG